MIWLQQGGLARQGGEESGCGGVTDTLDMIQVLSVKTKFLRPDFDLA